MTGYEHTLTLGLILLTPSGSLSGSVVRVLDYWKLTIPSVKTLNMIWIFDYLCHAWWSCRGAWLSPVVNQAYHLPIETSDKGKIIQQAVQFQIIHNK